MFVYPSWLDPVFVSLGPVQIRWYGLMYLVGFMLCYALVPRLLRMRGVRIQEQAFDSLWLAFILAVIIGARLGYIVFYRFSYYLAQPWEIFAVWEGGMAFHGGLVGGFLACWIFARRNKIHPLDLLDAFLVPISLALAFGRFGNFANVEIYGKETTAPWGMHFPGLSGIRHPTQLYKIAKDTAIFAVLWTVFHRFPVWRGGITGLFLILYGTLRFFIDYTRDVEEMMIGGLLLSQVLCLGMVAGGVALFVVPMATSGGKTCSRKAAGKKT